MTNQGGTATAPDPAMFARTNDFGHGLKEPYQDADGVWHNGLDFESSDMHHKIARTWQDQCVAFDVYRDGILARVAGKTDLQVPEPNVRVAVVQKPIRQQGEDGKLTNETVMEDRLGLDDGATFTADGIAALAKFTALQGSTYLDLMDRGYFADTARLLNDQLNKRDINQLIADGATRGQRASKVRDFILRQREDTVHGGRIIRAVVSERYGALDNSHAIDMISASFPEGRYKDLLTSHAMDDGDNILGNLFVPDDLGGNEEFSVGIAYRNSEVGKWRFIIQPFLFRSVCVNGMIWGRLDQKLKIEMKHVGDMTIKLGEIRAQVKRVIETALTMGNSLMGQMDQAREIRINVPAARVVTGIATQNKFSQELVRAWWDALDAEEFDAKRPTAFQLVNGLTRAAQNYSGVARAQTEERASGLLTYSVNAPLAGQQKHWNRFADYAETVDKETVLQYVGVAA